MKKYQATALKLLFIKNPPTHRTNPFLRNVILENFINDNTSLLSTLDFGVSPSG